MLTLTLVVYRPNVVRSCYGTGPLWLPIVGNIFLFYSLRRKLSGLSHLVWEELAKRYGPIFGVRMGRDVIVVVSGIELVREVLTREEFEGRPDGFLFRLRAFGKRLGKCFVYRIINLFLFYYSLIVCMCARAPLTHIFLHTTLTNTHCNV